jgi:uncharacterized protein YjdB
MKLSWKNVLRNVIALAFFVCVCIGGTSVCKADIVYGTFDLNTDYIEVTVSESPAFYKFTLPQDGLVDFTVQSYVRDVYFEVLNKDMTSAILSKDIYYASETSPITNGYSLALSAGTYCMKIYPADTNNTENFGKVRVKAAYTSYNATEVESVSMKKSVSLSVNETYSLNPTVKPADATMKTLEFTSSDATIASVDSDGTVRAYKAGVVTITAATTDGTNISAKTKVIVLPSQVVGLRTEKVAPTSLKLTWTAISGAAGYRVFTYDSAKKTYVKYKDVKTNSITIKKLKAEKKYKIYVQAYVKDGSNYKLGKKSEIFSTYTAPKKLVATKIKSIKVTSSDALGKSVSIKWDKVSGASGYIVYQKSSSGDWYQVEKRESTSTQIYLLKGDTYSFKVVPYRTKNGLTTDGKASNVVKKKI